MSGTIRKRLISFRTKTAAQPHEKFEVTLQPLEKVTLNDVQQVVGVLAIDLANARPPIPGEYAENITVKTGRDFGQMHSHTVTAIYIREDAATLNANELGYSRVSYPLPL